MLKRMLANRPPVAWTGTPQVPALMPAPPTEQSAQHLVSRNQTAVQAVPLPPPVLGPQPPHPRVTPMNQIGCESSSTYDYNEDEEPIIPYGVDAFEMIPQYYMEDHLGQVKPVYQASALATRG